MVFAKKVPTKSFSSHQDELNTGLKSKFDQVIPEKLIGPGTTRTPDDTFPFVHIYLPPPQVFFRGTLFSPSITSLPYLAHSRFQSFYSRENHQCTQNVCM
jgi:hypothetical protein